MLQFGCYFPLQCASVQGSTEWLQYATRWVHPIPCLPIHSTMLFSYFLTLTALVLCVDARQPAELFDAFEDFIAGYVTSRALRVSAI